MSEKCIKACEGFKNGYNCCQAVVSVFDEISEKEQLIKVASSFGGGVGGQRQICGATSGLAMVLGALKGYDTPEKGEIKANQTKLIKTATDEFKEKAGSIICGELLGLEGFQEIEKKYNCAELVGIATEIAEKYLEKE